MKFAIIGPLLGVSLAMSVQPDPAQLAIDRLHAEDVAATLAGDPVRLANTFTTDAVLLEPGAPPQLGRAAILAENVKELKAHPQYRELEYKPVIHKLEVHGDWAIEWISFTGAYREDPSKPVQHWSGKGLRVLRREADGIWKFSYIAWNTT